MARGGVTTRELALLITGKDVSGSKALKGVGREMNKLGGIAGKAGSNAGRNLERGILLGAGAAVGAVGYAVKAAMDFESSSASVRKTVDGDVDAILNANRELATLTGLEVNALNEISATAGALGVAHDDIAEFTKTVALLGVTTDDVTTELGATSLGHLKTTLKLAGTDFEHVGNTLVYLGNHGASTEGQILAMSERVAGAAQVMDASTPQVLGWSTALANAGIEAELGGSALQTFWTQSFSNVAAGNSKMKLMAKVSGQTAGQFKKDFGKDATGTLAKFVVGLGKMSKAAQLKTLKDLGLTGRQMTRVMLALAGNTDNLTDSLAGAEKGWKENNAATDEAAKRFATTAAKVEILKANVNDAAITIGNELLPVLADLSTDAVGWITAHKGEIHQFALDLSKGIKDAVVWAQKLDWNAIGNTLKAGAGFAKGLVDAFLGAPPWVQQFLAAGFVANKFTGGAVGDVIGELGKGLIKGILSMNAGVVNINAAAVNGGGLPGGAAGAAGGASVLQAVAAPVLAVAAVAAVAAAQQSAVDQRGNELVTQAGGFAPNASDADLANAIHGLETQLDGMAFNTLDSKNKVVATLNVLIDEQNQRFREAAQDRDKAEAVTASRANAVWAREAAADAAQVRAATLAGQTAAAAIRDKDLSVTTIFNPKISVSVSVKDQIKQSVSYGSYNKTSNSSGPKPS